MANRKAQTKVKKQLTRASLIFWIVIFVFYAAFFGAMSGAIQTWPTWLRIVVIILSIILPITGQVALIYSHLTRSRNGR